jgi:hypothetical protein
MTVEPSLDDRTPAQCRQDYERPDMTACATHDAAVCSLCLSTDKASDHVLPVAP